MMEKAKTAYGAAGVDIEAGDALVEKIKPLAKVTTRTGVMGGIGGFGALFDPKAAGFQDPVLVSSTDGVGTKLKIAIATGLHDTIGIDLVAMCVNDIIVQGAEPLFFLDYFATGKLDNGVAASVIAGIAKGCAQAGCALIGGETAEMPGVYAPGDYDLAGFTVGAAERGRIITGETMREGDIVLGLASSGVHSNGYSLVRHLAEKAAGGDYGAPAPFAADMTLGQALLTPTRIYVKPLLKALAEKDKNGETAIRGMAHITGGGLTGNIPRIVPDHLCVRLDAASWPFLPVFGWLKKTGGLSCDEMALTFNCGIGMAIVCAPESAGRIAALLKTEGESVYTIGVVDPRGDAAEAAIIDHMDSAWKR